ncbi:hypothetical protein J6590_074089, partial [Homalodisca vitripennis]
MNENSFKLKHSSPLSIWVLYCSETILKSIQYSHAVRREAGRLRELTPVDAALSSHVSAPGVMFIVPVGFCAEIKQFVCVQRQHSLSTKILIDSRLCTPVKR